MEKAKIIFIQVDMGLNVIKALAEFGLLLF
jgi:hypothetical protein